MRFDSTHASITTLLRSKPHERRKSDAPRDKAAPVGRFPVKQIHQYKGKNSSAQRCDSQPRNRGGTLDSAGARAGDRAIKQVAEDLDLTESALGNWLNRAEVDAGKGRRHLVTNAEESELASGAPCVSFALLPTSGVPRALAPNKRRAPAPAAGRRLGALAAQRSEHASRISPYSGGAARLVLLSSWAGWFAKLAGTRYFWARPR